MFDQFALTPDFAAGATSAAPLPAAPDAALLARLRDGDELAFADLVARESAPLLRLAWRLTGQRDEAEDLVQEAFLRFHRSLPRFRGEAAVSTWLYRTVTHLAIDQLRRQRLRRALFFFRDAESDAPDPTEAIADPSGTPLQQLEQRQLAQRLNAALRRLPPRQRAVFVLRHHEGLPLAEIARLLGTREGTVKCHLHRAVGTLRQAFEAFQGD